jgi:hypothetical protein
MTTEQRSFRRQAVPLLIGVPLALLGALLTVALAALFQPPGRAVAVISAYGAEAALDAVVAAGGSILSVRGVAVLATSDEPGFVPRLYAHAPILVLGAERGGCGFGAVVGLPAQTDPAYLR